MKKMKRIGIALMLALMFVPTLVSATNEYYSDSYMMYRYSDSNLNGANCTAMTEHNQRYRKATAEVYHSNGTGQTQTKGPGVTARVSISTNRYSHIHGRK